MAWKKFSGPAILVGIAILLYLGTIAFSGARYDDGETIESGDMIALCGTYLLLTLLILSAIVWFAFALGGKTQKVVFSSEDPSFQQSSTSLASDSHGKAVTSTIGADTVSYVQEKFITAKSEDDTAQMVGFLSIVGSVLMFVLMIILGAFWILSGIGPGLGGSGGTCDETCESLGSAAEFCLWASLLLFLCGLIALARPWSWFRSGQDFSDPVVKVRIGIVTGVALIAVISFGWPALLVLGIALVAFVITR